jgi:hypothetical protein
VVRRLASVERPIGRLWWARTRALSHTVVKWWSVPSGLLADEDPGVHKVMLSSLATLRKTAGLRERLDSIGKSDS